MRYYYLIDRDTGRVLVKASYPLSVTEKTFLVESNLDLRPEVSIYDFKQNNLLEKSDSQLVNEAASARRAAAADSALLGQKMQRLKKEVGSLPAETREVIQLLLEVLGL